jgi:putative hydrolase of the HAD superfamily
MNYRAVIVDRDGVLTDFEMAAAATYFAPLLPISLWEMSDRWEAWGAKVGFPRSLAEERRFFAGFWDALADEFGLDDNARVALHGFDYTGYLKPFADAAPALDAARRAGLKIGVLSNFTLASLEPSLEATGLAGMIDAACAATVIGASKPDVKAYRIAADALGAAPREGLCFDAEQPCVDGARAAGMTAYLVDRSRNDHDLAQGVVCDLSGIEAALKQG